MERTVTPILLALAVLGLVLLLALPPIAQPQWYHNFADQRFFFGISHFWNVISNIPFLIVGLWGIYYVASPESGNSVQPTESWMYLFLFAAVALTGVGSAYYHLKPDNDRLVWDRLPIAVMFMALFAVIMAERLSRRGGALLFAPLVFIGAATVLYWDVTESWGRGDLRPYLLAQFYPMVAIPVILWRSPPRHTGSGTLYTALAWYAGAKLYEFLDKEIYSLGQIVSGHTLKHLGASVSCYLLLSWIRQRQLVSDSKTPDIVS
jgi:hypothetical protein